MAYYYLSLGTNIDPEVNSVKMLNLLLQEFGALVSYPFIYTQPEKIESPHIFINSVAIILSSLDGTALKARLNAFEISLGRDRDDPNRSIKDRPADIDILGVEDCLDVHYFANFAESYINICDRSKKDYVDMRPFGLPRTEGPTPIHFDAGSGNICVLDQAINRLEDWHKTTLVTE